MDEIEKEKAKFQAAINSIKIGFIITDEKGEIETINSAAKAIFCQTKSPAEAFSDPDLVKLECKIDDVAEKLKGLFDIKSNITRVLQSKKPIQVKNLAFFNLYLDINITPAVFIKKEGVLSLEFIGTVILVEDVTEEKLLERSRQDLFSIASHELKTPLAIIKGNVEIIKKYFGKGENTKFNEMLNDIYDSNIRLLEIVDDFLDISHLEQGKIEYKKDQFEITQLTQEVIDGLESMATRKHLYLKLDKSSPIFCLADKNRTKQVFINLLGNAIKFTEFGGVTTSFQKQGNLIKILVEDTGIGISAENQALVFRKFQLATDEALTRNAQRNTGIGLYISKILVEGMGGQIRLERSIEGKGSIFSFTLPIA